MNELQVFKNDMFGELRTIEENGKTLFCAIDVARALGYKNPNHAISRHCRYCLKRAAPHPQSPDREIDMTFIPEGDIYRLIVRSTLPAAEKFEQWVFDDILPTIRRHGMYATKDLLNNPDLAIAAFQALKDEREQKRLLEEQLQKQLPYVRFAETVQATNDNILVRECSKLASNYIGVDIGEKKLYQKLREWNMILKHSNEPSRRAYHLGILVYIERTGFKNGLPYLTHTTKVTPKGQVYIINRLINESQRLEA